MRIMSYQVLARKWRPQTFSDVVGQQHVLTVLTNSLQQQRLHHAYLFSGVRGVGKTTIARLFAKGLNCELGISQNPCSQCINCLEVTRGGFIDLIEIDAASRTKVEDMRELIDNIQYTPVRGRFKVYLIDEVHMLSRHSFNALLKTLEEPPEHVKFILATTDPQKLPITILSRCFQLHLKTLDVSQISNQLERILTSEQILYDKRACQLIARAAKGSLRDALSLTDQAIVMDPGKLLTESVSRMLGILDDRQSLAIIEAIVNSDSQKMMAIVNDIALRGSDWESVLVEMLSLLHRIAMIQLLSDVTIPPDLVSSVEDRLRLLACLITPTDLQAYYQTILVGRKELPYAPEKQIGVEMTLLRAMIFHPKSINNAQSSSSLPLSLNKTGAATINNNINSNRTDIFPQKKEDKKKVINQTGVTNSSKEQLISASSNLQSIQAKKSLEHNQGKVVLKNLSSNAVSSEIKIPLEILALKQLVTVPIPVHHQQHPTAINKSKQIGENSKNQQGKFYLQWKQNISEQKTEQLTISNNINQGIKVEFERNSKVANQIALEAQKHDHWSAEIHQLKVSKLVEELVLNSYKESLSETEICLHLRSTQWHLNTKPVHKVLIKALCKLYGKPIKLIIIKDDNPNIKTPLEWQRVIYEQKLIRARQSIFMDKNVLTLCELFDAQLDEKSIVPI